MQKFKRQSEHRWVSDRLPRSIDRVLDVDSDWPGDKRARKSTVRIVARHGVNVIKTQVNAMNSPGDPVHPKVKTQ